MALGSYTEQKATKAIREKWQRILSLSGVKYMNEAGIKCLYSDDYFMWLEEGERQDTIDAEAESIEFYKIKTMLEAQGLRSLF